MEREETEDVNRGLKTAAKRLGNCSIHQSKRRDKQFRARRGSSCRPLDPDGVTTNDSLAPQHAALQPGFYNTNSILDKTQLGCLRAPCVSKMAALLLFRCLAAPFLISGSSNSPPTHYSSPKREAHRHQPTTAFYQPHESIKRASNYSSHPILIIQPHIHPIGLKPNI
jgi:hypothetical protein